MTLQQLEYIIAVDRFRHFAKAAEHCNVTQPTLSAMIGKLEEELGTKIFDRSIQPVKPTEVGRAIIDEANKIVYQSIHLKDIVEESADSLSGSFSLGVIPTIAPYLLPRFFPDFIKEHTGLELKVYELQTEVIKEKLQTGDLDAAIVADLEGMEQFQKEVLYYEQFYAYIAEDEPLASHEVIRTSELDNQQLWMLDEGHCFRDQMIKFCQLRTAKESRLVYHLGSIETFMRMVENGKGMTFIPELAILQLSEEQKRLVHSFAIPSPTRCIQIITRKGFIREKLLEVLKTSITAAVPKKMLHPALTQIVI